MLVNDGKCGVEGKVTTVRARKKNSGVLCAELHCSLYLFSSFSSLPLPPTSPFLSPVVPKYWGLVKRYGYVAVNRPSLRCTDTSYSKAVGVVSFRSGPRPRQQGSTISLWVLITEISCILKNKIAC